MSRFQIARLTLLLVAISVGGAAYAQESVRAELGKPLQQAQEMMRAQRYKEALAKVRDADRVGAKNPTEQLTLDRMRGAAAQGAGDNATAAKSYESAINSGRMPATDNVKLMQALAILYYRAQDYAKAQTWIQRYIKEGGTDPQVRALLAQTYFLNNDFTKAQKELQSSIQADEKAGRTPSEESLQLLVSCALKLNDNSAYVQAMEKLVGAYPKKQYWADLVNRISSKKGFSDRYALDVFRLRLASGLLKSAGDYMEMSQLALQAGFGAEGKKIADMGFKAGVLGVGAEGPRQKRLQDLANKNAAEEKTGFAAAESAALASKDGTDLVNLGYSLVAAGQAEKGLALMEQGIKKGGLKRLDEARLHLGVAYASAGKKDSAIKAFKTVQGTDGAADLARLWVVQTGTPMN
ncbi:tetratricopeptide repeat protein [Actimicrobium antarcticum]|uniref:Tetratricopeptide repeat protein n=1 Tax=Actimicrobium antarcticum TaxID=1051899 RepID=A0ABP7SLI6_9BURK